MAVQRYAEGDVIQKDKLQQACDAINEKCAVRTGFARSTDQSLAVPVAPASGFAPSGFDPERGDLSNLAEKLRHDADEIEACGGGNEAATMRRAAAEIERIHGAEPINGRTFLALRDPDIVAARSFVAREWGKDGRYDFAYAEDGLNDRAPQTQYALRAIRRGMEVQREITASAIEARSAETGNTDSVHESAVPKGDAQ